MSKKAKAKSAKVSYNVMAFLRANPTYTNFVGLSEKVSKAKATAKQSAKRFKAADGSQVATLLQLATEVINAEGFVSSAIVISDDPESGATNHEIRQDLISGGKDKGDATRAALLTCWLLQQPELVEECIVPPKKDGDSPKVKGLAAAYAAVDARLHPQALTAAAILQQVAAKVKAAKGQDCDSPELRDAILALGEAGVIRAIMLRVADSKPAKKAA